MTKTEFLEGLQEGLDGEVAPQVVRESVDYYNRYIMDSIAEGKTEEQVLEELGSVRLIVKSIIDANTAAGRREETRSRQEQREAGKEQQASSGFHADVNDKGEFDLKYGRFSFNSWYGKLLLILLAVLIVAVIIVLLVGAFVVAWYLLPVIAVVVLIVILAKLFFGRRT